MRRIAFLLVLAACDGNRGGGSGDNGSLPGQLPNDAAVPPGSDASVPPGVDAGTPPPGVDAGVPPPGVDAGVPPPGVDAGVPPPPAPPGLRLVSARTQIDGYFLTPRAITADSQRIYLASRSGGSLFVFARDRAANFPIIQRVEIANPGLGLSSVTVDATYVYVTTVSGDLVTFTKNPSLSLVSRVTLAPGSYSEDAVVDGAGVIIADGSVKLAATSTRVFVHPANENDAAIAFSPSLERRATYVPPLDPARAFAFDRATGALLGSIAAPADVFGGRNMAVMDTTGAYLAAFVAGCCGAGVDFYNPDTLVPFVSITRWYTNAIAWSGGYLVIGGEEGGVDLWQIGAGGSVNRLATLDLRALTGHTSSEAIEIRALWTDPHDRLIFAGSSWGNDQNRSLDLPSFFVLERTGD